MWARAWRRVPPLAVDVVLAVVFLVVGLLELIPGLTDDGYHAGPLWVNVVIMVCFQAPLAIRRRAPRASFLLMHGALVLPCLVTYHSAFFFATTLPSMLTTYTLARYGTGRLARWSWLSAAATVATLLLGAPPATIRREASAPVGYLLVALVAWGAGRVLRRLAEQGLELQDALEQLSAEQAVMQASAVSAERARIAVEMHDVVDHAVSLMVIQIDAARDELQRGGIESPRLLAAGETGQQALLELRRTLGVLREKPPTPPESVPGLAATAELAERFRAAGLDVRLAMDSVEGLSAGVQLAAYRILQEAMTNALKHGGREWVSATVLSSGQELTIIVRNPIATTGAPIAQIPSGRHGLIGMRERVAMFGGSLRAERDPASPAGLEHFEVRAVLPLTDDTDAALTRAAPSC